MTYRLSGGSAQPKPQPFTPKSQSAQLHRAPFPLILGPPEHQKREQKGPRDPRQPKSAFQDVILSAFDRIFISIPSSPQHYFCLVPLMFASSRVREHVAISCVFTSRERSLPFCQLRERCKPERPNNDKHRARCWLPQHAQQGKKKGFNISPKCFQNRPRELRNPPPEHPKSSRGAPGELQRASQEPPDLPREPLTLPRAVQGASLRGTLWEAFWDDVGFQIEDSEPMLAHFPS